MPSDRRTFLRTTFGAVVATAALPPTTRSALGRPRTWRRAAVRLRDLDPADEPFWELVKAQFPLHPDVILMNAANLCPSPLPVSETVTRLTRDVDGDASFQNRGKFGELRAESRRRLASYLGVAPDEIALTRNTTEGNNTVIGGLDLGSGDEVVIWDQNHPTNNVAWDVRAARHGFDLRRVATPPEATTAAQLVAPFESAITSRTRVLAFSHVSNVTGVGLPATTLCRLARERGIFTLIDGAQTFGSRALDLHAVGCDAFTGSAHKWFCGPKEVGLLYVRRERSAELWPATVGVGWERARDAGARRFETLGQRDDAAVAAVAPAVQFHETIGRDRVEARIRTLAATLRSALSDRIPDVQFHTPADPSLRAGVVVFHIPGTEPRRVFTRLYAESRIGGAAMGGGAPGVRLCPHVYNTMAEIERAADAVAEVVKREG